MPTTLHAPWPALVLVLALPLVLQDETGRGPIEEKKPAQGIPNPEEVQRKLAEETAARQKAEIERHFRLCDDNRNGWISFREAEYALLMDRNEFRLYDANGDGRIDAREFEARYRRVQAQIGGFPALREELQERAAVPEPPEFTPLAEGGPRSLFPTPSDLLLTYDANQDDALNRSELGTMFRALAMDLPTTEALNLLDTNRTAALEMEELVALAEEIARRMAPPEKAPDETDDAEIFRRLYSDTRPRLMPDGSTPRPPLIPGPVSHFRRLDLDDNGFIDGEDLADLLAPSRVAVRPSAVLSALDRDGDGRLDEAEFLRSVGAKAPLR